MDDLFNQIAKQQDEDEMQDAIQHAWDTNEQLRKMFDTMPTAEQLIEKIAAIVMEGDKLE